MQLGLALEIVGVVAVGLAFGSHLPAWRLCPELFVYGLGVGLATAQLTSVILADVPPAQSGEGSGIQSTARQLGSALGIAILGTALAVSLADGTRSRLSGSPGMSPAAVARLAGTVERSGGAVLPALRRASGRQDEARAVEQAFVAGARTAAWIAAGFLALGLVAASRLPASARGETAPRARLQADGRGSRA